MSNKRVDWSEPLYTRGGSLVRFLTFNRELPKPVVCMYESSEGWILSSWYPNGLYNPPKKTALDIVNHSPSLEIA